MNPRITALPVLRLAVSLAVALAGLATSGAAEAAGLNDPGCKPTALRPFPAVVVHGQGGNFEGLSAITTGLVAAGYCVYARNYGSVPGGANGQDHLAVSASQVAGFVDQVLAKTGAQKVDVVGHSAGTGVLDNYILKKGGAAKVHRMVSFGGLHHPYAHAGLAKVVDASIFLPNMIAAARLVVPGITTKQVVSTALDLYGATGAPLGPVDPALVATMESNFTVDLFDPVYWKDLHGGLSETPGVFLQAGTSARSVPTVDAAPNVCYTNIVAAADLLAGAAAGFQDDATNVENILDVTTLTANAHIDMTTNPVNLLAMVNALSATCTPGTKLPDAPVAERARSSDLLDATTDFEDALLLTSTGHRKEIDPNAGCSMTGAAPRASDTAGLCGLGIAIAFWSRRRGRTSAAR